ncbi:hypothetical protein L2734_09660 [Parashewanella spongiae]|uniref:hypothetical protein n=1 Tax=Parashewanella spongiae TaxID=342950 RepID=UPI0014050675|nr:hypothetical protein [Parashewanella spongiae]MCL1078430.1 hypothetical protein [Parashewanella spongiae]
MKTVVSHTPRGTVAIICISFKAFALSDTGELTKLNGKSINQMNITSIGSELMA